MSVIITDTAAREISNIMKQQDLDVELTHLRVGVKGGGCSGTEIAKKVKRGDNTWHANHY